MITNNLMELHDLFGRVRVGYLWMFITEKCNLDCDYCFYKERDLASTVSFERLQEIIMSIPSWNQPEFVFSGGEPLIEFGLIKKTVALIKKKFQDPYFLIQTNGILLRDEIFEFLLENNINLEFGFDGLSLTTLAHRKKTTERSYEIILQNIQKALDLGIGVSCTMVVHPNEADRMQENFQFLLRLGIPKIEITPATCEMWTEESKNGYLERYKEIVDEYAAVLSTVYDRPISRRFDAIVTGLGDILPSWISLSFPREVKGEYAYFKDGKLLSLQIARYLKLYNSFFSQKNVTYREFSTLHAKMVYDELEKKYGKTLQFSVYKELCDEIKIINQTQLLHMGDDVSLLKETVIRKASWTGTT